jgi:hypothetical protein
LMTCETEHPLNSNMAIAVVAAATCFIVLPS